MRIILTGVPGTGKSSISRGLARLLRVPLIDINAVAKSIGKRAAGKGSKKGGGEVEVNLKKLQVKLSTRLKKLKSFVAEGHLASDVKLPVDLVVVLRCNPLVLSKRLRLRGYGVKKVGDNVMCEALDYCLVNAEKNYGRKRVIQVDATRRVSLPQLVRKIRAKRSDKVNWSTQLLTLANR